MKRKETVALALALGSALVLGASVNTYAADHSPARNNLSPAAGDSSDDTSGPVTQYVNDATITTRVKSRFAKEGAINSARIKVETTKGVVELSGSVTSSNEKTTAGMIAEGVQGVKGVRNNLAIKGSNGSEAAPNHNVPANPQ